MLAGPWHIQQLDEIAEMTTLDGLAKCMKEILAGEIVGRTLVVPGSTKVAH
jgi:hypothetical protein